MRLKKFNEFNSIKQLDLNDLSMWLRPEDIIKITTADGIGTYKVKNMDELGIRCVNINSPNIEIDFDFEYLNGNDDNFWELGSINGDEVYVSESASYVDTPKLDILISKLNNAGYPARIAQDMVEVDEEHETADVYIHFGDIEEPFNFTIYPDGSIVWDDFSHSTPFGNINNPEELTKEFIDARLEEVDELLKTKLENGRN